MDEDQGEAVAEILVVQVDAIDSGVKHWLPSQGTEYSIAVGGIRPASVACICGPIPGVVHWLWPLFSLARHLFAM